MAVVYFGLVILLPFISSLGISCIILAVCRIKRLVKRKLTLRAAIVKEKDNMEKDDELNTLAVFHKAGLVTASLVSMFF